MEEMVNAREISDSTQDKREESSIILNPYFLSFLFRSNFVILQIKKAS